MPPHEPISTMPPGPHAFAKPQQLNREVAQQLGEDRGALGEPAPIVPPTAEEAEEVSAWIKSLVQADAEEQIEAS